MFAIRPYVPRGMKRIDDDVCHGNVKNEKIMDTQLTYQNFLRERRNSYRKFQPLRVDCLSKLLKNLMGGGG